jgi:hypothetical protein
LTMVRPMSGTIANEGHRRPSILVRTNAKATGPKSMDNPGSD